MSIHSQECYWCYTVCSQSAGYDKKSLQSSQNLLSAIGDCQNEYNTVSGRCTDGILNLQFWHYCTALVLPIIFSILRTKEQNLCYCQHQCKVIIGLRVKETFIFFIIFHCVVYTSFKTPVGLFFCWWMKNEEFIQKQAFLFIALHNNFVMLIPNT